MVDHMPTIRSLREFREWKNRDCEKGLFEEMYDEEISKDGSEEGMALTWNTGLNFLVGLCLV
jgi:hypothetical protein